MIEEVIGPEDELIDKVYLYDKLCMKAQKYKDARNKTEHSKVSQKALACLKPLQDKVMEKYTQFISPTQTKAYVDEHADRLFKAKSLLKKWKLLK